MFKCSNGPKLMAGSPPISLSLIVGKRKCDAQASVTRWLFFFFDSVGLYNTSFLTTYPFTLYCIYSLDPPSGISIEIII